MRVSLTGFCDVTERDFHGIGFHKYGSALACKLPLIFNSGDWDDGTAKINQQALRASVRSVDGDSVTLGCGCTFNTDNAAQLTSQPQGTPLAARN
jgi:hypothetical protein